MTLFGCDVSNYQPAAIVPWDDERIDFGIVKLTEATAKCSSASLHIPRIREAQKTLGAYCFFHPEFQAKAQHDEFYAVAVELGYGLPKDIVPAIDVEYFSGHAVTPAWQLPLHDFADLLEESFARPMMYCSASTWACLGRPQWLLEYPLWVPMYMADGLVPRDSLAKSLIPGGGDYAIWQHYVGPVFGKIQASKARGAVDQNRANWLPLIDGTRIGQ